MTEQQTKLENQTRLESFIEAAVNTMLGYITAMITQIIFYPLFNIHVTIHDQLLLALLFTIVSLVRNYFVRRVFNNYYQAMLQWLNSSVSTLLCVPNNVVNVPKELCKPKPITEIIDPHSASYHYFSKSGILGEKETSIAILKYYEHRYPESNLIIVKPMTLGRSRKCFEVKIDF